jgi:hypothetical protein
MLPRKEKKMKNRKEKPVYQTIWIIPILGVLLTGCAGNRALTKSYPSEKIIHYSQLKNLTEPGEIKNYAIYVNPGETIPMKISMESDFMDFKQKQIDLIAKEKLYFMVEVSENLSPDEWEKLNAHSFSDMTDAERAAFLKKFMVHISRDGLSWAPLFGGHAYREVLGFKEGRISFAVMASKDDGLGVSLDIKTVK